MLRDTGCSLSLVRSDLVDPADFSNEERVRLLSAFGTVEDALVGTVDLECDFFTGRARMGVLPRLPVDVLIGNDIVSSFAEEHNALVVTRLDEEREANGVSLTATTSPEGKEAT